MSPLELWIEPSVHNARKRLPGATRQQVKTAIASLSDDPRPPHSRALDVTGIDVPQSVEVRRLRMERWRLIYAINEAEGWVWVLGIYRRPPYDYDDLAELVGKTGP